MTYYDLIARHDIKPYLGILPGYGWLEENEHKLDNWRPEFEVDTGTGHYKMQGKAGALIEASKIILKR